MNLRYFEDYEVGSRSTLGAYHVTKDEVIDFAKRWDPQPFHVDEAAAGASVFGRITAASSHTYAICSRLYHENTTRTAMVAALGNERMTFPNPVCPGDVLSMTSETLAKRVSRTRRDRGIVTTRCQLMNQNGDVVLDMTTKFMVLLRPDEA